MSITDNQTLDSKARGVTMMGKNLIVFALILVAIPCGEAFANPMHDKLMSFSAAQRNQVFTKFVQGENCGKVVKNFFWGRHSDDSVVWDVQCSSGRAYHIKIQPDANGSSQIMDCKVAKAVANIDCFKKP